MSLVTITILMTIVSFRSRNEKLDANRQFSISYRDVEGERDLKEGKEGVIFRYESAQLTVDCFHCVNDALSVGEISIANVF